MTPLATSAGDEHRTLVVLSARVYAQPAGAVAAHFRDQHGRHEVDLILERPGGKVLAVEVKLSQSVGAGDVKHLTWLKA